MAAYTATLDDLKQSLNNGKTTEATKDRELKDIKESNKDLEAAIGVIEQISADYQGKLLGFQKNQDRQVCYQKDTLARVKAKLGDTKPVDDLVKAEDDAIDALAKNIKDVLVPAVTAAKNNLDLAVKAEETKRAAFEALKNKAKTIEGLFKAMDDLSKNIDGFEKEAKLGKAYFLLLEHALELKRLEVETIPQLVKFQSDLITAQTELATAAEDLRTKRNLYDDAVKARDEANKQLDKRRADRRQALLDKIVDNAA